MARRRTKRRRVTKRRRAVKRRRVTKRSRRMSNTRKLQSLRLDKREAKRLGLSLTAYRRRRAARRRAHDQLVREASAEGTQQQQIEMLTGKRPFTPKMAQLWKGMVENGNIDGELPSGLSNWKKSPKVEAAERAAYERRYGKL